jgi:formate dehydrogenase major subunit
VPQGIGEPAADNRERPPVRAARRSGWQWEHEGLRTRRTMGLASLGGATLDNEENYLIKKLFTALGAIQTENQARI